MRRRSLWIPTLVCAVSLLSAPATAAQGQGQGKPNDTKAPGQAKQKPKASKKSNGSPATLVDERARFHGLDGDRDGVVTRAEWKGDDRSFANHDWNHDGVLSGGEMDAGAPRQAFGHAPTLTPPAPKPVSKKHTESDEALFARRDTNHDQRVSRDEWTGEAGTFDRLDVNKDGWLSPYEYGVGR